MCIQGDPTTPGTPSYRNANRTDALSMPSIPSLPISYNNGKILLEQFEDASAVFSKREVRLLNTVHGTIKPIWNTMAVVPGYITDEIVVLGNHRDGEY
jgi:N-acetylated-alpha-linked acidic dipeptidase